MLITVRKENVVEVARVLQEASIRYVFAGGVAVIAHGYVRTTHDLDIVVRLKQDNVVRVFEALASIGYQPKQPITGEQFADQHLRESWRSEKGMLVLQFWADGKPGVDVFVYEPFDFEQEYAAAEVEVLEEGIVGRFLRVEALLEMKKEAGRHKDLADIEALLKIYE